MNTDAVCFTSCPFPRGNHTPWQYASRLLQGTRAGVQHSLAAGSFCRPVPEGRILGFLVTVPPVQHAGVKDRQRVERPSYSMRSQEQKKEVGAGERRCWRPAGQRRAGTAAGHRYLRDASKGVGPEVILVALRNLFVDLRLAHCFHPILEVQLLAVLHGLLPVQYKDV